MGVTRTDYRNRMGAMIQMRDVGEGTRNQRE
jgi:hypothetical protein